jgi:hypothetical protein
MKTSTIAALAILATSIATIAASPEADPASKQLQIYPKNLARQHVGTNLFLFNQSSQTFTPTEAAAACWTTMLPLVGQLWRVNNFICSPSRSLSLLAILR